MKNWNGDSGFDFGFALEVILLLVMTFLVLLAVGVIVFGNLGQLFNELGQLQF